MPNRTFLTKSRWSDFFLYPTLLVQDHLGEIKGSVTEPGWQEQISIKYNYL